MFGLNCMPSGFVFSKCYTRLEEGGSLTSELCDAVWAASPCEHQLITLVVKLLNKSRTAQEGELLRRVARSYPDIPCLISVAYPWSPAVFKTGSAAEAGVFADAEDLAVLRRIGRHDELGLQLFSRLLRRRRHGQVPDVLMALVLALIQSEGLRDDDVLAMTQAMAGSGERFDYRDSRSATGSGSSGDIRPAEYLRRSP